MKVGLRDNLRFGRALTTDELAEYVDVRQKAREVAGKQEKSILIIPSYSMPQSPEENTGMGHLASKNSGQLFDFFKAYLGVNVLEDLPPGQVQEAPDHKALYRPYSGTTISLGNHNINADFLTTYEYGYLLDKKEFDGIVKENTTQKIIDRINPSDIEKVNVTNDTIAHFENVVNEDSPFENALRKAFDKFESSSEGKISEMKKRFESYKTENSDWLEPKGIFEVLKRKHKQNFPPVWNDETDKNLYNPDFDEKLRKSRLEEIKNNNSKEIEFYKFKQFLAEEHLALGKKQLNEKGGKLFGDCPIGFSNDEVWANPKAFRKDHILSEFKFVALDYDKIKDENSESAKLLKRKVELCAKRYDGIRFDASWCYIKPKLLTNYDEVNKTGKVAYLNLGFSVMEMIEKTVKKVKGEDFDLKNLVHEIEADQNTFDAFEGGSTIMEPLRDRVKVYGSLHMNNDYGGWGYSDAMARKTGEFVLGPGNHDPLPLRQLAEEKDPMGKENMLHWKWIKERQVPILADILNLDIKKLAEDPVEFVKAKLAEPLMAKNNMIFYLDVFGRKERFNSQENAKSTDYRYKISQNFEADYHKSLQEGYGFNIMDSFEKIFKAKGYDQKHQELYKSIVKFRDILYEKGALTEKEANEKFPKPKPEPPKPLEPPKTKFKYTNLIIGGAIAMVVLIGALFAWKQKEASKASSGKG